jgi:hypothetical protein
MSGKRKQEKPKMVVEETLAQIPIKDLSEFKTRAKHLYTIRTEDGKFLPFELNEAQEILHDIVEEEFARTFSESGYKKCKLIILKGRQVGATTYTAVRFIDEMLESNKYGLVATHTDDDTSLIYDKYEICYDALPDYIELVDEKGNIIKDPNGVSKIRLKPATESYSAKSLKFSEMTKSWLMVRTAGSGDNLGKGTSYGIAHYSEAANYTHYKTVLTSSLQAVRDDMDQFIVIESTANGTSGVGSGFYEEWKRNTKDWEAYKRGEAQSFDGFRPVFIPWWKMAKYTKALAGGQFISIDDVDFGSEDMKKGYFEREEMLMTEYGVSKEAINWYRHCIKNKCQGSLMEAYRYYPCFADDAFIVTDKCFFDSLKLMNQENKYENNPPEITAGYLDEDYNFVPSLTGELHIKAFPEKNYLNRYIVSADPGRGYEDGDYTVFKVFDRLTDTWVARWKSKISEDLAAFELMKLAYFYNEAYIIPEANLATIINVIKPDGIYPYTGSIYVRGWRSNGEVDWGFLTTGGTRKPMLDELNAFIRPDYGKLFDGNTTKEYRGFVRRVNRGGTVKYEADAGEHDDEVIADALCIVARNTMDEELAELNKDYTDIVKFVNTKPTKRQGFRQSSLGSGLSNVSVIK